MTDTEHGAPEPGALATVPAPEGGPETGEESPAKTRNTARVLIEWVALILAAVVIAIGVRTFLFQAFYIPSESMVPTLEVGDRVLVNKLSYDLHDVNRGDIVVFESGPNARWANAGHDDLVKRVIGLPGETVTGCNGGVCINGRSLDEGYLPDGTVTQFPTAIRGCTAGSPPSGCTVPAGRIFVLGDNRPRSQDARYNGPVKESSIVGRVFVRIWPVNRLGFL